MGLAGFGALAAITLALLAQSPRLLTRLNLTGSRLDLRAKAFTGYGLALLLLAMGFFLAGVPLGPENDPVAAAATTEATPLFEESPVAADEITAATPESGAGTSNPGSQTGAMVGLPTRAVTGSESTAAPLEPGALITGTQAVATVEPIPPQQTPATAEATPRLTATLSPSATPTPTPSPTPTATPILVPTARIGDDTSTLPVRRSPAGPVLVVLVRGDTVIPLTGRAFHSGEVWREIQTVTGIFGWVPDRFLEYPEE